MAQLRNFVTRPRIYLAGSGQRAGLLELARYRRDFGQRLRQLRFEVIEPYSALLRALEGLPLSAIEAESPAGQLRIFTKAIKEAAQEDLYFRVLARELQKSPSLHRLQTVRFDEIASRNEISDVYDMDAQRIAGADALVAYLPAPSEGTRREALVARSQGILSFAFGAAAEQDGNADLFAACFPHFDALVPTLDVFGSGEGPYLTSAPVNSARGHVLIYGIDLAQLAPHRVAQVFQSLPAPSQLYSFCCERSHVHELAQKLPVMLRVGKIQSVTMLTKDGSPHDVQMHTMAQEVHANVQSTIPLYHFVVEKGRLVPVSAAAVKSSRHLHSLDVPHSDVRANGKVPERILHRTPNVAVLVGGKDDLETVEASGLIQVLKDAGLNVQFEIISSDRQPEQLRLLCLENAKVWDLVVAAAGGVPNLPVTVKSWLPHVPVIGVPLDEQPMLLSHSLSTPSRVPIIMTGFGERGARKAGRLALQLLEWKEKAL